MGLDGGTYATRSDVLRRQSSRVTKSDTSRSTRGGAVSTSDVYKQQSLAAINEKIVQWSTCNLSGNPLEAPILADELGNLYNKESVLEFLLSRKQVYVEGEASLHRYLNTQQAAGHTIAHLQSVKDVFPVCLAHNNADEPSADGSPPPFKFMCPITMLACGRHPCSALRPCGHVLSDRAVAQLSDRTCPLCSKAFTEADVIPLYGTPQQQDSLKERMQQRRSARLHKGQKRKATSDALESSKHGTDTCNVATLPAAQDV